MKKTLYLLKAQPIGKDEIQETSIIFEDTFPEGKVKQDIRISQQLFVKEAKALEDILYHTLPGGTYDRLLAQMLDRRRSHFIVPFGG